MIAMYQGGNIQLQPHEFLVDTVPKFKLDNAKDITRLKNDLILHRPDILILDPWYKMLTVEDNRSYSFTQDVMDGIIEDFNLSIVVIHHDTKPQFDPTSGGYSTSRWPRGPRTVEGWFDTIISMGGDLDTDLRELRFEARHATRLIYPIQIELNRAKLWMVRK
jgi:RecA-family ATPase